MTQMRLGRIVYIKAKRVNLMESPMPAPDWSARFDAGEAMEDMLDEYEAEVKRLRDALRELINAGEPFTGDAFPNEQMTGEGLRLFNRWMAAMNDARTIADT